jgi:hypothetical protein
VGFEPTISAGERPQTYALDRAVTGTGIIIIIIIIIIVFYVGIFLVGIIINLIPLRQLFFSEDNISRWSCWQHI